jgi:hypothetical protein
VTESEPGVGLHLPAEAQRPIGLVLSRMVGEVRGRHVAPQICRLVAETFGIPGPWPDEEYSLRDCGCDWDAIAARWSLASPQGAPLADEVIGAFFPSRLWPAFWQLVVLGPVGATRMIEATLQAAGHGLTPRGELRPTGALSAVTVDSLSAAFGRFARAVIELRKQSQDSTLGLQLPREFEQWTQVSLPKRRSAYALGARQQRRNNTKAVRLRLARLVLQHLNDRIERARQIHGQIGLHLRNRALIGILLLGPRIGTVAALDVCDYERHHLCPDGTVGPALSFRRLKSLPGISRWRGIPPLLADWIEEYLAYYALTRQPDAPLWRTKRAGERQLVRPTTVTLTAAVVASFARVQPPEDGRLYRPHSLRHLAEQVCYEAAFAYLIDGRSGLLHDEANRGVPANPQVFCDCLLDHALHDISDRYKDVNNEDGREIWGVASPPAEHARAAAVDHADAALAPVGGSGLRDTAAAGPRCIRMCSIPSSEHSRIVSSASSGRVPITTASTPPGIERRSGKARSPSTSSAFGFTAKTS